MRNFNNDMELFVEFTGALPLVQAGYTAEVQRKVQYSGIY